MAAFTASLIAAGAVLSLLTRVHGLILVLAGLVVAILSAAVLSPALGTGYGLSLTLVVAVIALQVGYGLGVILRAVLGRRADERAERDQPAAYVEAPEAMPQRLRRSHDGGPLNHP
ncbi:hypothetical protein [Methylobacterium dankookense]|uniref:Uncharacterized protein n=1 Tax=Methylobacterium dankookense TaxID=560405 RepID=A0A564FWU5_9HYPH|nr:hypothetical protein [Methylobacterium dankookense]GJD54725.1 hypothetical protein IFDJLNFL_0604 [Methylobacterium dankookense]VUF12593.1 hypothetical protein MTDSW087_02286 [Methylobacterium dankookense]